MKTKIDEAMHKVTKESSKPSVIGTQFDVDMNMTIVNIPMMFAVGTSYEVHPPYPQLGNRVIYVNNHSNSTSDKRSSHSFWKSRNCHWYLQIQDRSHVR